MSHNPQKCVYYLRIIRFIVEVGTETVRNLFYHFKPKHEVHTFFTCGTICDELRALKRRHVLSCEQYRQVTSDPNPNEFDLALLITLLTNIFTGMIDPPANGWNRNVDQHDISIGANLLRLKHLRNAIVGHSATARLTVQEFNDFWKQIEETVTSFELFIDVRNKDAVKTKIDEYKYGKLDLEGEQERKYFALIRRWYNEGQETLSYLRDEVEDLVKKSKEFFFYFKTKPKRYLRYIKLLFEGGRMVLSELLNQELEKTGVSLNDFLLDSREMLLENEQSALTDIYPQNSPNGTRINTNTSTWDIQSLALIISHICNENQVILNEVYIISNARKEYAKTAYLSLNNEEFSICCEDLVSSLKTLSPLAGAETYTKCRVLIEKYRKEVDTDIDNTDTYFDQLKSQGLNVKNLSEMYTEVLEKLNIALNQMADGSHVFKHEQVLELKMVTLGRTEEKIELAENILATVWEAAIKMSDTPKDFAAVRNTVDLIIEHVRAISDVDTIKVEKHCILMSVSCRSCLGLMQLMEYLEGDSFKEHLTNMSLEIGHICNDTVCIKGNVTFESLYQLATAIECDKLANGFNICAGDVSAQTEGMKSVEKINDDKGFREVLGKHVNGSSELGANIKEANEEITSLQDLTEETVGHISADELEKDGIVIVSDEKQIQEASKASILERNASAPESESEKKTQDKKDNKNNGEDEPVFLRTIQVRGSGDVINVNTLRYLKMYFKDKGRSDGATVNVTEYKCIEPGVATFTFETKNDAESVAERDDHVFRSEPLNVAMMPEEKEIRVSSAEDKIDADDTEVKRIKITKLTSSLAALLGVHLEKMFPDVHVVSVKHEEDNKSAVVEFEDSKGFANILQKKELSIDGQVVGVELYENKPYISRTVLVKGSSDIASQLDSLKIYFQNTALSGGGNITNCYVDSSNNVAYVTFETEDVAQLVVEKFHNKEALEVMLSDESLKLNKEESDKETKGKSSTAVTTNQIISHRSVNVL
ncbi:uncharacterized protein LOC123546677 [Mercenaria mercenaria]|uniref:uncharacterized protein LOC123546677 n=1 Tax=Mercenaria mercenaria TaxID=6596 RepID=UPI00234E9694|nr:uncharacterized protein LOC123546677 [Mercenaria mercenaria]